MQQLLKSYGEEINISIEIALNEKNKITYEIQINKAVKFNQFIKLIEGQILNNIFKEDEIQNLIYTLNGTILKKSANNNLDELGFKDNCILQIQIYQKKIVEFISVVVQLAEGCITLKEELTNISFSQFIQKIKNQSFSVDFLNYYNNSFDYILDSETELQGDETLSMESLGFKPGSILQMRILRPKSDLGKKLAQIKVVFSNKIQTNSFEIKVNQNIQFFKISNFIKAQVQLQNYENLRFHLSDGQEIPSYESKTLAELHFPLTGALSVEIIEIQKIQINLDIQFSLTSLLLQIEIVPDITFKQFIDQIRKLVSNLRKITQLDEQLECKLNSRRVRSQHDLQTLSQLGFENNCSLQISFIPKQYSQLIILYCIAKILNEEIQLQIQVNENAKFFHISQQIESQIFSDDFSAQYKMSYQLNNNQVISSQSQDTLLQLGLTNFSKLYLSFHQFEEEVIQINIEVDQFSVKKQIEILNNCNFDILKMAALSKVSQLKNRKLEDFLLNDQTIIQVDEKRPLFKLGFQNNSNLKIRLK